MTETSCAPSVPPPTPAYVHWRLEWDDARVLWLHLDMAGSSTNVLSRAVIDELDSLVAALHVQPPAGLVLLSAKPGGFVAGADVKDFEHIANREEALALTRRGHALMDTLERLPCPKLALIHGYCLGGGLELALACDYRVVADDPSTRLGLPEVRLGIHPGYGGVSRSIRTIGPLAALDLMLSGRSISAKQARTIGLIEAAVPARQLRDAARDFLRRKPPALRASYLQSLVNKTPLRQIAASIIAHRLRAQANPAHYPAPYALLDLWRKHGGGDLATHETQSVAALAETPTARNLVRVFLLQEQLKALAPKADIAHVHVIGAGAMGADIALWCAQQGLRVSLQDTDAARLAAAVQRMTKQLRVDRRQDSRAAAATLDRLMPDLSGAGIAKADVVIEAIVEKAEAKIALYRQIEPRMKPDAMLASNTSSIPLAELAKALAHPERLVALHFFNPVGKLPLVEIARTAITDEALYQRALGFVRRIDKLPLPVKDEPGFLVNRILMPYLLEAALLVDEGVAPAAIDRAARDFGMPMGPVELADRIGLDICLSVAQGLGRSLGFELPAGLRERVAQGHLGLKSGQGFYRYRHGRLIRKRAAPSSASPPHLDMRLILPLLNTAVASWNQGIVGAAEQVDAGAVFGAGFAPFRGGPMQHIANTGAGVLLGLMQELQKTCGPRFKPDPGWLRLR